MSWLWSNPLCFKVKLISPIVNEKKNKKKIKNLKDEITKHYQSQPCSSSVSFTDEEVENES